MSSVCDTCSVKAIHRQSTCLPDACHLYKVEERFFWIGLQVTYKLYVQRAKLKEFPIDMTVTEVMLLRELNSKFLEKERDEASKGSISS